MQTKNWREKGIVKVRQIGKAGNKCRKTVGTREPSDLKAFNCVFSRLKKLSEAKLILRVSPVLLEDVNQVRCVILVRALTIHPSGAVYVMSNVTLTLSPREN